MAEGSKVPVREAIDADGDAFAVFFREAWEQSGPEAPGFVGATDEVIDELTTLEAFRDRVGGPDRRMFLAWDRDRVVGFAATRRVDDTTVELAGIIVLPVTAGRGVGSALLAAAVATARDDEYREMTVLTESSNDRARAFYEAHEFVVGASTTEPVEGTPVELSSFTRNL
jgi:ribosomal protein S18 acetylase RimI-like enzyme